MSGSERNCTLNCTKHGVPMDSCEVCKPSERNFEQLIEYWHYLERKAVSGLDENSPCKQCLRLCADEASTLRERLVGLVREWRELADRADKLYKRPSIGRRLEGSAYRECADALEQILGPLEGK